MTEFSGFQTEEQSQRADALRDATEASKVLRAVDFSAHDLIDIAEYIYSGQHPVMIVKREDAVADPCISSPTVSF